MRVKSSIKAARLFLGLLAFVLIYIAGTANASAQAWLSNRTYGEGIGVKLGSSMVFHPGLGVEGGYDSNVYNSDSNAVGAARLRIAPYLDLATLPPQRTKGFEQGEKPKVDFRLGLAGVYEDWYGSDDSLDNRRDFGVLADLALTLFPYGKFRLKLEDQFTRTIMPPNESGPKNYSRDYNEAGLTFMYVPGDALKLALSGRYFMNYYELGQLQSAGNYHQIAVGLKMVWKFLPKTALTFDGDFMPYFREGNQISGSNVGMADTSYTLNLWFGMSGLFTKKFGMALRGGYSGGFYNFGDNLDTWLLNVEFRVFTTPMSVLRAGFIRDPRASYFTNYFIRNEGYISYEHLIRGRVLISVKLLCSYLEYSTLLDTAGQPSDAMGPNADRTDIILGGLLFLEYRIRDWIAINLTAQYEGDITDYKLIVPSGDIPEGYHKFVGFVGVRANY